MAFSTYKCVERYSAIIGIFITVFFIFFEPNIRLVSFLLLLSLPSRVLDDDNDNDDDTCIFSANDDRFAILLFRFW